MEITCIIVDDEPLAIRLIENFVKRTPYLRLMGSYDSSIEALAAIKQQPVQLLFLDIQMPDLNGMELSRLVETDTKIIFTTAFKQYAFDSYEVSALDFLLKPISYPKFLQASAKALQWFEMKEQTRSQANGATEASSGNNHLFIRCDNQLQRIDINEILYVSGLKDYVHIYIANSKRPLISHLTMKAIEGMLPRPKFMRIHRSYIVAMDRIRSIDRSNCVYIGEEIIHVSDAYKEDFNAYLEAHMIR